MFLACFSDWFGLVYLVWVCMCWYLFVFCLFWRAFYLFGLVPVGFGWLMLVGWFGFGWLWFVCFGWFWLAWAGLGRF